MGEFETGNNGIDSSSEFDGIANKKLFLDAFENVKSWYGNNFTGEEMEEIKNIWNIGYNRDFKDKSDDYKKIVFSNRIDKFLFESRNKDYVDIDVSIIRKFKNASTQRKFREIAVDLKKKLKVSKFSGEKLATIKSEFLKAKNSNVIPNTEKIINILKTQNTGVENNNNNISAPINGIENINVKEGNVGNTIHEDFSQYNNIFEGLNIQVSENSNIFKTIALEGNIIKPGDYGESKAQTMKDYYNKIDFFIEKYDGDKDAAREILMKNYVECYSKNDLDFGEFCVTVFDEIGENDPSFAKGLMLSVDVNDDNDDDLYWDESENFTEEEKKDIESFVAITGLEKKELVKRKKYFDILSEKIKNKDKLSDKEQQDYAVLCMLFGTDERGGYIRRSRKLKEMKDLHVAQAREYTLRHRKSSIEYATGNIKDIKPMAIIENNNQIKNYVYGKKKDREKISPNDVNLSRDDKIRLFNKLKKQKAGDMAFMKSKDYFDDNLTIKEDLVNLSGVSMENVIERKKEIEKMINDLAVQENLEKQDKERIKEINVRRSCMVCCFRAISKFFDTVNNNGENFASEFEIKDVNENIEFNEKTGVISMEGTIGANRNHVKLYYDTKNGTLEFDDFLVYNPEDGSESYSIGNGNKKRRRIGLELPKMSEMEKTAKSINSNLISKLSLNMNQYNRMQGFAMSEAIYLKHFIGLLGVNMESVKGEVQKFNEENILKQDIIKTIYSKFYNVTDINEKLSDCLIIDEGNKPEQFKLIELIYNTIDNYRKEGNTSKLLRLRNCINEFDKILTTNHELVEKDNLLRYLFADNPNIKNDAVDSSKNILENENKDLTIGNNKNIITYQNHNDMIRFQKYENQGIKELNYYIFLNLLAKDEGDKRIINLRWFENALEIMKSDDGSQISKMNDVSFRENIDNFQNQQEIDSIESAWGNAYEK